MRGGDEPVPPSLDEHPDPATLRLRLTVYVKRSADSGLTWAAHATESQGLRGDRATPTPIVYRWGLTAATPYASIVRRWE